MKAFTLVEMLVSIGILVILGGMIAFNQGQSSQTYDLANAAQRIQAELRKTQGFAMATKNFNATGAPPLGGWGIHMDKTLNYYSIFGDQNSDGVFDASEEVEKIYLPKTIDILSTDCGNTLNIIYKPPLLGMTINDDVSPCATPTQAIITLHSLVGSIKTVKVNAVGNVIIQ